MGQMGNSEEAVVEDDLPFDMYDLDVEEEDEYNNMAVGGMPIKDQTRQTFQLGGTVQLPGFTGVQITQPTAPTTGYRPYVPPVQAASSQFVPQYTGVQYTTAMGTTNIPTFAETVGKNPGQYDEFRTYVNDAGQTLQIPFKNGQPIYPIPYGYRPKGKAATTPTVEPTTVTGVQTGDGEGGDRGVGVGSATVTGTVTGYTSPSSTMSKVGGFLTKDIEANANAFGGSRAFGMSNKALRSATFDQALYQLGAISPKSTIASALAKEFGFTNANYNDMAVAGQQAKEAALTTLGFTRASQLQTNDQATMYGNMISAAHAAAKKGENVTVALAKEMSNPAYSEIVKGAAVSAMQGLGYTSDKINDSVAVSRSIAGYRAAADAYRSDAAATKESGTVKDSRGNPVKSKSGVVMSEIARNQMNAELEAARTADAKADSIAAEQARSRGNVARDDAIIGEVKDTAPAKAAAAKATDFDKYGDEFGNASENMGNELSGDFSVSNAGSYAAADAFDGEEGDESSGNDKIVCTAMNNAYGFGSFRQTVWLQHSKNMDPAYQKGYHRIFKPLIKFAYKDKAWYNMFVRSMLEGIARRRTADIWMQKHGKRHLRGAVERAILEPLCYIVGKIK